MGPHHFHQFLDLSQHPFAALFAAGAPALLGHLDAQAVDALQETLRALHPAAKTLAPD
jgi:hypothetical protein